MSRPTICRVYCETCGDRALYIHQITIRHCLNNHLWEYRFNCPTCRRLHLRPIPDQVIADVIAFTFPDAYPQPAALEEWRLPAIDAGSGPPISMLDLIHLVDELDGLPSASHDA